MWWLICSLIPLVVQAQWVKEQENPGMFEGDMLLSPQQMKAMDSGTYTFALTKRNLWPKTGDKVVIGYTMDSSISGSSKARSAIQAAIADYEKYTCIKLVQGRKPDGYIHFRGGGGCSSPVGMQRGSSNRITLAGGCWHKGTVLHEIAHSLGVLHEQSRPDRDQYVEIVWGNIQGGMDFNFKKRSHSEIDSLGSPYDYDSVMHYGKTAFGGGRVTIRVKQSSKSIGNRSGFSIQDIFQLNKLYRCNGGGPNPPTNPPPGTWPTQKPPPGGCRDTSSNCRWNLHKCNWDFVRNRCKKSCKVC